MFSEEVKDYGTVDRTPALEGKSMFMTLASVHKPRVHEHKLAGGRPEGADAAPEEALEVTPEESSQPAPAAAAAPAPEPQPAVEASSEAPEAPVRPAPQP